MGLAWLHNHRSGWRRRESRLSAATGPFTLPGLTNGAAGMRHWHHQPTWCPPTPIVYIFPACITGDCHFDSSFSIVFLATSVSADVSCGAGTVYVAARAATRAGAVRGQPTAGACMSGPALSCTVWARRFDASLRPGGDNLSSPASQRPVKPPHAVPTQSYGQMPPAHRKTGPQGYGSIVPVAGHLVLVTIDPHAMS